MLFVLFSSIASELNSKPWIFERTSPSLYSPSRRASPQYGRLAVRCLLVANQPGSQHRPCQMCEDGKVLSHAWASVIIASFEIENRVFFRGQLEKLVSLKLVVDAGAYFCRFVSECVRRGEASYSTNRFLALENPGEGRLEPGYPFGHTISPSPCSLFQTASESLSVTISRPFRHVAQRRWVSPNKGHKCAVQAHFNILLPLN